MQFMQWECHALKVSIPSTLLAGGKWTTRQCYIHETKTMCVDSSECGCRAGDLLSDAHHHHSPITHATTSIACSIRLGNRSDGFVFLFGLVGLLLSIAMQKSMSMSYEQEC